MSDFDHWNDCFNSSKYKGWNSYIWLKSQENAFKTIREYIISLNKTKLKILEIGAGNGNVGFKLVQSLDNYEYEYTITDFIPSAVDSIRFRFANSNFNSRIIIESLDIMSIEKEDISKFDIIFSTGLASAISHREHLIHLSDCLSPNQIVITDIINPLQLANLVHPFKLISSYRKYKRYRIGLSNKHYHFGLTGLPEFLDSLSLQILSIKITSFLLGLYKPFFVVIKKNV